MRKLLALLLLLPLLAQAGTINGKIQTASGGAVANGTLTFSLNQVAYLPSAQVVAQQVPCYTDNFGNIVGEPDQTVAPSASVNLGSGTLAAGTYFVKTALQDASGVSNVSPEASFTLSAPGTLIVTAPGVQPANASGFRIYIGTASGNETLQGTVTGTPGSWANFSQAAALSAGSAMPVANTTVCTFAFTDSLNPSTTYYTINLVNSLGSKIAGYPISQARFYGGTNGSVNVSSGWPVSIGGVIWPSPIVSTPNSNATQSIAGGLSLGTFPLTAGTVTTSKINQTITVQPTDTGADMCAKIQNKINTLPTGSGTNQGGIIDATSFTGDQSCASTLTLGVANQSIVLYLGLVRIISQATPVIKCPTQVSCNIFGSGTIAGLASNNTGGTQVVNNGASNDAFDWFGSQGTIQNMTVVSAGAGVALFVKALAGSGHGAQQNVFMNMSFSGPGSGVAGGVGIQLQSNSASELSTENVFTGMSLIQFENAIKMTTTLTQGPTDNWFNGISILGGSPGGTCINIASGDINWFTGGIAAGCATGVILGATATQNAFAIRFESNTLNINNAGIGTMFVPANLDANTITDTGTNTVILGAAQVNIVQKIGNGGSLQVPLLNSNNPGTLTSPSYAWTLDTGTGMWNVASDHSIRFSSNGVHMFELVQGQTRLGGSGGVAGFSSAADPSAAGMDVGISRLGAALIGIGNGTAGDFSGGIQEKLHRFSETTAPSALSTVDICYGDSTAHKLECAYNNAAFFPMTQTIGSSTVTTAGTAVTNGTCQAQTGITITGSLTTDQAVANINAALPATWQTGIQWRAEISAAGTCTVNLCNPTAGSITPAATSVRCTVTR